MLIYFPIYPACAWYAFRDIPRTMNYIKAKELFELYLIITALDRHGWKVPRAAEDLGITKQGVFRVIKEHKLKQGVKPPQLSAFLFPEGVKLKPVRRVVLFAAGDFAWLRRKNHLGSYSQLIGAGIRTLRAKSDARIRQLL